MNITTKWQENNITTILKFKDLNTTSNTRIQLMSIDIKGLCYYYLICTVLMNEIYEGEILACLSI